MHKINHITIDIPALGVGFEVNILMKFLEAINNKFLHFVKIVHIDQIYTYTSWGFMPKLTLMFT
jgi:hypothetical protein